MKSIALPYWGQIISLVSNQQGRSLFITRQQSPVLYILDNKGEQFSLSTLTLPCAMQLLIRDTATDKIILLGADAHLYQSDWQAKKIIKMTTVSLLEALSTVSSAANSEYIQQLTYTSQHNQFSNLIEPVALSMLSNTQNHGADNISVVNGDTLAVLYPKHIVIWRYQSNQAETSVIVESLFNSQLEDSQNQSNRATAMATSSDGHWLVVGDKSGFVRSYQLTTALNAPLSHSSRQQIHQGAVNALCFEPIGQYFFSAGADKKLYRTHVQGDLHPVDRAKASQHSEMITALCVSATRLFSASDDKSIKSWAFDKGGPNTCKEDLAKTRLLVLSSYGEKAAISAVGQDQSLRFIPIETEATQGKNQIDGQNEKLQPVAYIIKDGYQRVSELLKDSSNNSDAAFKEGLALLNAQVDHKTLDIASQFLTAKSSVITANQALQLVAWVAATRLDKTAKTLEQLLNSTTSANVRLAAFNALAEQANHSERPLQYLARALESKHEEIVASAIQGYLQVALNDATSQRRIIVILQQTLSHKLLRIRKQALAALETLLPDDSPKADLLALECHYPDVIQAGLIRLYQRDMLASLEVSRQLMLLKNHDNADVRQTAFYISVLSQPKLAAALKHCASQQGDTQLLRTLSDFDAFQLLRGTLLDTNNKILAESEQAISLTLSTQDFVTQAETITANSSTKPKKDKASSAITLSNQELEPLLQSLASPYQDISFRAAYALACQQDKRAFGSLIRLMHADVKDNSNTGNDAVIRAGVARALGTLAMEDGKAVLPVLLDDKDAGVRMVAMKAFGKLADSALAWAAVGFAAKHQDIHEQALALLLTQVLDDSVSQTAPEAAMPTEMTAILLQALNNPFTSIRLEVVKVLLNRELKRASGSSITATITLLQQSLFEDVHQVAIEEWQRSLLNTKPKAQKEAQPDSIHQAVLTLLLADNFAAIRQQAFDTALKNAKRLPFTEVITSALTSPFLDIKKLALTTLQAKASPQQLKNLLPALVGMLAYDSIELRGQALSVALALTDLQPSSLALATDEMVNDTNNDALISAALASPYPDIQLTVAQLLASQSRLQVNEQAAKNDEQAYAVFERYLSSAMPTLDKSSEAYKEWHQYVSQALLGLSQLANPSKYNALNWYAKYLRHDDADFSDLAPKLMWLVATDNAEHTNLLIQWQKDERAIISQSASLALAVCSDTRGQYFFTQTVKNNSADKPFSNLAKPVMPIHWLQAQQGLGIKEARQLRYVFDSESYAPAARLLLIFNDIQQSTYNVTTSDTNKFNSKVAPRPQRLIEALSFVDNETAVVYANILARYPAQLQDGFDSVWQYLSDYLTRKVGLILSAHSAVLDNMAHSVKGSQINKTDSIRITILASVSAPILRQLATFLSSDQLSLPSNNQPLLQARAIGVIGHLSELLSHHSYDNSDEVLVTLQQWQRSLQALLGVNKIDGNEHLVNNDQLALTHSTASKNNSPYQTLAFGAWLGVIREGDNYYANNHTTNQAIRGLMWLATQDNAGNDNNWSDSVSRALLPLLNHNDFDTRKLAWDCLYKLEISAKNLSEYAMSTSHPDMVKQGLQLLLKSIEGDSASGVSNASNISDDANSPSNQQLIALLKTNNQSLAEETYKLLKQRLGLLPASLAALDSYCDALRYQVVSEWQQVKVTPFAMLLSENATENATDNATENTSLNQQRRDKLTFLLQAIQSDNWHTRYYAFVQLIDFYDVLFSDSNLFDALFEFWRDSQSWSDVNQAFSLIISALQLYNRVNKVDNQELPNAFNNGFDNESAKRIVDNTYAKLLGLLDYPQHKMSQLEIYQGIASLRDTTVVASLLQRLRQGFEHLANQNKSARQQLFDTLVTISGYDQPIEDYLDEAEDKRWLQQQHPRHSQVLLALFTTLMNYGDYEHAAQLLASLSWARATETINKTITTSQGDSSIDAEIDAQLALAYEQLPAKYTFQLVQTLAYRAERRDASLTTLQKALTNKDADVQFLAAEGLAKCGQAQGLTILMATVDYNPDGELRRRSVLAIGELMGSRSQDGGTRNNSANNNSAENTVTNNTDAHTLYKAYDKLIKLAEDDEHYLQDVASEALGRLAQSGSFKYSRHIFELLKSRLLDPNLYDYNPAIEHWLNGLRWLNTLASWELIRSYIKSHLQQGSFFAPQTHAISLLAFDNGFDNRFDNKNASKTLLLDILKQNDLSSYELMITYAAAQKLWGNAADTVYPYDWATLQNNDEYFLEETSYLSLKRVTAHASIDELTTFISQHGEQLPSDTLTSLQNAIMTKTDMSKAQLVALIESSNVRAQLIGLSYLAQYPTDYLDKDMFEALQHRFTIAKDDWQILIDTINHSPITLGDEQWLASTAQTTLIIKHLIWLMCRYQPLIKEKANLRQVVESVTSYLSGAKSQTGIQHIIDWLNALRQLLVINTVLPLATSANDYWQQLLLALLARPVSDDSLLAELLPLLRSITAAPTEQLSYANQALLTTLIMRLEQNDKKSENINEQAAISIHQQLLLWIKAKDAVALYNCAINEQSDIATQVRAIEALGQLHEPKIEQWLESLMKDGSDDNDEDIQKLAYKVLRRWQRAMARAQQKRPSAFASMDVINSPVATTLSTQGAGDNK